MTIGIARWKFQIHRYGHCRTARIFTFFEEVVFDRRTHVTDTGEPWWHSSPRVEDRQQRRGQAYLDVFKKAVGEFEVGGVLSYSRSRRTLQPVKLVAEFEMKLSFGSCVGVVCDEGLLAGDETGI